MSNQPLKWQVWCIPHDQPKELVAAFARREDAEEYAEEFIRGDFHDAVVEAGETQP